MLYATKQGFVIVMIRVLSYPIIDFPHVFPLIFKSMMLNNKHLEYPNQVNDIVSMMNIMLRVCLSSTDFTCV